MKIERNNKYNKCKTLGLAVIVASGIILSGCNNVEREVVEPTEVVEVVKVTPTPTEIVEVTPTPTIKPTPIPTPELSSAEIISLLGIKDPEKIKDIGSLFVIEYTINNTKKISFIRINALLNDNNGHDIYNWFSNDIMFKLSEEKIPPLDKIDYPNIVAAVDSLEGAVVDKIYIPFDLENNMNELGFELENTEFSYMLHPDTPEEYNSIALPQCIYAYMYFWAVPTEENKVYKEDIHNISKSK